MSGNKGKTHCSHCRWSYIDGRSIDKPNNSHPSVWQCRQKEFLTFQPVEIVGCWSCECENRSCSLFKELHFDAHGTFHRAGCSDKTLKSRWCGHAKKQCSIQPCSTCNHGDDFHDDVEDCPHFAERTADEWRRLLSKVHKEYRFWNKMRVAERKKPRPYTHRGKKMYEWYSNAYRRAYGGKEPNPNVALTGLEGLRGYADEH